MKTVILAGICGAFILFGVIAAVGTAVEMRAGLRSLDWPMAEGEITRSERRRANSRLKRLEYRYAVAGQEYTGWRAAYVRVPYWRPTYKLYRPGRAVAVRYDPENPAEAVLEPGAPVVGVLTDALVPLLLVGFGGIGLFYGLKRR